MWIHEELNNKTCSINLKDLTDYKFYCFNGESKYCQVIRNRSTNESIDFYDMKWDFQNFTGLHFPGKPYPHGIVPATKPSQFEIMKNAAEKLSQNIPFVRIDFYEVNGHMYFGEITFFPVGGFGVFEPDECNVKMGNWLKLPN